MTYVYRFFVCATLGLARLTGAAEPEAFAVSLVVKEPTSTSKEYVYADGREGKLQVETKPLLAPKDVKEAKVDFGPNGFEVMIKLTDAGSASLAKVTAEHQGEQLAFLLHGKILSAPRIMTTISGGSAQISGNFTEKSAHELADFLNGNAGK